MANYNVSECITNINYIVSAGTLTIGSVIGFNAFEENKCGVVGEESTDNHDAIFVQNFESCCECLSALTDTLNFRFIGCEDELDYNIEATNFCNDFGTPLTGRTYLIRFGSETPFCAKFQELSPTGETNYFYVGGPYDDCSTCDYVPTTYSSGTYSYKICDICTESGTTTATEVEPPHPTYINSKGDSVIQTQMVALGGINGLNS